MNQPAESFRGQPSDGQLLVAFVQRHEQAAFTQIVRRHGDMVWAVCLSVLGNGTDAQDAAQAVFMTLAHKASSLQARATLAGWLHRVAWYVATRAAAAAAVRRQHEREAARMNQKPRMLDQGADLPADRLHEGLSKLPEKYRLPLILHHLEGRSQEEVAVLLCQKTGTVVARLSRGRAMLRKHMLKGGMGVTAVALTATLGAQASASIPATVAVAITSSAAAVLTGKAAAVGVVSAKSLALSKGALQMLYVAKIKLAALYITAALVLGGGAVGGIVVAEKIAKGPATLDKNIYVLGGTRPGTYTVPNDHFRLTEALAAAGGATGHGDSVRIIHPTGNDSQQVTMVSVDRLQAGDANLNSVIHGGDYIVFEDALDHPGATTQPSILTSAGRAAANAPQPVDLVPNTVETANQNFYVLGGPRPGAYGLPQNNFRVLGALAAAVGTKIQGDFVRVIRSPDNGSQPVIDVPLAPLLDGQANPNIVIRSGDVILYGDALSIVASTTQPSGAAATANAPQPADLVPGKGDAGKNIYVHGQVDRPGTYSIPVDNDNFRLLQALASMHFVKGRSEFVRIIRHIDKNNQRVIDVPLAPLLAGEVSLNIVIRGDDFMTFRALSGPADMAVRPAEDLDAQLDRVDGLRAGFNTPFDLVESQCNDLLQKYTAPEDQAKIYFELAHVQGQSGLQRPEKTIAWIKKALDGPLPIEKRAQLYVYWGSALEISHRGANGEALKLARKEAAVPYLTGLKECLHFVEELQKTPLPVAPQIPPRQPGADNRAINATQHAASSRKQQIERIVGFENAYTDQLVYLYSRFPLATEELEKLAGEILDDKAPAEKLMAQVRAEVQKRTQ